MKGRRGMCGCAEHGAFGPDVQQPSEQYKGTIFRRWCYGRGAEGPVCGAAAHPFFSFN